MTNNVKKIVTLLKMKQMYLTIIFIAVLIFLLSVVQNNTVLESMGRACIGTIISTIVITIMWMVIYNMVEPFIAGDKEESTTHSNNASFDNDILNNNSEPVSNPQIAISDDDININDIYNQQTQTSDNSNDNTASNNDSSHGSIEENKPPDDAYKKHLNENKEVDNSNELLYHNSVGAPPQNNDYDTDSIDFIISSNDGGGKSDKEETVDIDQAVDVKNSSSAAGKASNFEDFSDPALSAQVIRTMNARGEGKGNT